MPKLVINLDKLDVRELFEAQHQWTRDIVKCAIRLATTSQIDMNTAIRNLNSAIACKTVADHRKTLVTFHAARSLEEFIEHCIDNVFGGGNHPLHGYLIRELASN